MVDVHLIQHGETMMISMNFSGSGGCLIFLPLHFGASLLFAYVFPRYRSRHCFDELRWPWNLSHPFFMKPVKPGKVWFDCYSFYFQVPTDILGSTTFKISETRQLITRVPPYGMLEHISNILRNFLLLLSCILLMLHNVVYKSPSFASFHQGLGSRGKHYGKTSFVEHRTFLHLYHSFHRLWMFLIMMFQVFCNNLISVSLFLAK